MAHLVLALGTAVLTVSGSVWYLPAVADVRAGDDRPRSARLAAIACVSWWLSTAGAGALLLTSLAWQSAATVALAGAVCGALLRWIAEADRRAERREDARRWAAVRCRPMPAAGHRRPQPAVLAWLVVGLAGSSVAAASILLSSHGTPAGHSLVTAACCSLGVSLLALLVAATRARH